MSRKRWFIAVGTHCNAANLTSVGGRKSRIRGLTPIAGRATCGAIMCGRYTLRRADKALERITGVRSQLEFSERFNVAPTQEMPVVLLRDGSRVVEAMRWGFVPFYERSKPKPQALINARSETAATKAPFKRALQKQRCLVPADGFFEWKKHPDGKSKTPYFIHLKDDEPFAFAGLWEPATETLPAGFLLLTTTPNNLMAPIHDRMPVILPSGAYDRWLSSESLAEEEMKRLCAPYPTLEMKAVAISALVNSPKNDTPEILEPA